MSATKPAKPHDSAPAEAFAFEASACQFAEPSERKSGLKRMSVEVLARTGKPVYHWYWDWIVHDFEGMTHKPAIAFDYRHDPNEPIGVANQFELRDGNLYLSGDLISRTPDDEAAKIMDLGPAGVPYEQSIHFNPNSVVLEYLPEGMTTTVNGGQVNGPITIVRQWELLRCAFCLTGVDGGTQTFFDGSADVDKSVAMFALNWKGTPPMSKTETPAEQGSSSKGTDALAGQQAAPQTPAVDLAAERAKFDADTKTTLKRYIDKFGAADGATYFSDSLSYEAALEKHTAKLEASITEANAAKAAAEDKLAKLDLGETTGIESAAGDAAKKTSFESMFRPEGAETK